jgi:hypothetical protein
VLLFLFGFAALLVIVTHFYLLPAMEAARVASPREKQGLVAYSRLLLVIVLFILFVGLIITFRIGRFFLPRHAPPATPTKYSDAWSESGKRLNVRSDDDAELQ